MIEIILTQGQTTIIDSEDKELINSKWHAHYNPKLNGYYAMRTKRSLSKKTVEYLHRAVLSRKLGRELERKEQVDHINRNTLDNRRENLRLANASENLSNQIKHSNNTSGYKGVSWAHWAKKWRTQIMINRKLIHIGYFTDIEDAAKAYQEAAIKYHGEFARWE